MRYMLHKQAVSLNCVQYYYISILIANLLKIIASLSLLCLAALLSLVYVDNGKC